MSKEHAHAASTSKTPAEIPARLPNAEAQRESNPLFGLQRELGNQAMLRLLESGLIQTKLRVSQPGDSDEQEADRVADHIVSAQRVPVLQRKCACSGGAPCSKCAGDQEEDLIHRSVATPALGSFPLSLQRALADATTGNGPAPPGAAAAAPQSPGMRRPGPLIVEDDAKSFAPGQMKKSAFFDLLQADVCATADAELAVVGRSTKSCPYIEKWLAFYRGQSSSHIEQALIKYAPEAAGATSARDYIVQVRQRVRQAVATWAKTGEVTGVPPGVGMMPSEAGGAAAAKGAGSETGAPQTSSGGGGVQFKEREGASAPATDAESVRAQLGHGRALDTAVSERMGSAFGRDFSSVRVHDDASASSLSSQLNARAFTVGDDVAFATGEYKPGTLIGDALIAHELAHVVQQDGGQASTVPAQKSTGGSSSQLEEDADRSAVSAVVSAWAGAKKGLLEVGKNAMPRLRSGLRLQACKSKSDDTPAPKTEPEIACTAQAMGQNVAECMTRANKQPYSCTEGIHYSINFKNECPALWKDDYMRGFADPTYFDQLPGNKDWLLKPKKSASAALKKWLSGLTIAECETTVIACEMDSIRRAIGDAKFDSLYGAADREIPEDRRLHIGRKTPVPNIRGGGLLTPTTGTAPGAGEAPGNRPAKIGEWYYFRNHPMYLKKHPGGSWQGENAVYVGLGDHGEQLWIGLGSSSGPPLNRPEVTEDQMINEMLQAYNADPWGPDLPKLDSIRSAHGGVLPPEYQEKSTANPGGYPKTVTKQELLDAGGGFIGGSGKTLDVGKVQGL